MKVGLIKACDSDIKPTLDEFEISSIETLKSFKNILNVLYRNIENCMSQFILRLNFWQDKIKIENGEDPSSSAVEATSHKTNKNKNKRKRSRNKKKKVQLDWTISVISEQ